MRGRTKRSPRLRRAALLAFAAVFLVLGCKRAKGCEQSCAAMASTGVCDRELGAFFQCLKAQPTEHWECLEDGTAAIREGYCESEQAGFAQCLQSP